MKYGFFYDSYDSRHYYWESVILVEKLLLVVAITLMRRWSAAAQVLLSLVIVWAATILHLTFRPSGCRLLHTLQRGSLFVLQVTLYLLMLANLPDMSSRGVVIAALCVAAALNAALLATFAYAFVLEVRRLMMVTVGRDTSERMTAGDVGRFLRSTVHEWCGGGDDGVVVAGARGAGGGAGGGGGGGGRGGGGGGSGNGGGGGGGGSGNGGGAAGGPAAV
jgi:hypothetical protein